MYLSFKTIEGQGWGIHWIAVFMTKISPMLDFNVNNVYFHILWPWYQWFFWTFLVVFTNILARKSWNPRWYSWSARWKKLKPFGSSWAVFLFCTKWNHFAFTISCQKSRETTKKVQNIINTWSHKKHGFYLNVAPQTPTLLKYSFKLLLLLIKPPGKNIETTFDFSKSAEISIIELKSS